MPGERPFSHEAVGGSRLSQRGAWLQACTNSLRLVCSSNMGREDETTMETPSTDASSLHAARAAVQDVERFIERGSPEFFWANLALFAAGFATFALLYCVQPIMPLFSREFGVSPAQASLSMSVATQALAAAMLVAGALSEVYGRKPVMAVSIVTAALLLTASAFAPTWNAFLLLRLLSGLAFSGLPATAMAYVGEGNAPRRFPAWRWGSTSAAPAWER